LGRARSHPILWRQVVEHAGVKLPTPRKVRWRR
jgi:hypothetical protein